MNKEILDKVDEIIKYIENSDDYKKYCLLKKQMEKDDNLRELIKEIKKLQKEQVLGKKNNLDEKLTLLNENPLYREYNNTLYELNNMYAIIENTLNKYFMDTLN